MNKAEIIARSLNHGGRRNPRTSQHVGSKATGPFHSGQGVVRTTVSLLEHQHCSASNMSLVKI